MKKLRAVGVGGTFDELHLGHKKLLMKAFEVGRKVFIGLSSDELVNDIGKNHDVASYEERRKELKRFLAENSLMKRAEIVELKDVYGLTLQARPLDGLVVSKETADMAMRINRLRKDKDLQPLSVIIVEMIPSENHSPISSTRIRRGEMDRDGRLLA